MKRFILTKKDKELISEAEMIYGEREQGYKQYLKDSASNGSGFYITDNAPCPTNIKLREGFNKLFDKWEYEVLINKSKTGQN